MSIVFIAPKSILLANTNEITSFVENAVNLKYSKLYINYGLK